MKKQENVTHSQERKHQQKKIQKCLDIICIDIILLKYPKMRATCLNTEGMSAETKGIKKIEVIETKIYNQK